MSANPLVSVVVPTRDRARLLGRALDSIAKQQYRPIQAVVVDDGSRDETPRVIEGNAPKLAAAGVELLVHRLPEPAGVALARNTGIECSTGAVVAFLDSDDLWRPPFLSTLVSLLERHPSCGLAFTGVEAIDEHDRSTGIRASGLPAAPHEGVLRTPFETIARQMPFFTSSVAVRREVLDASGLFDTSLVVGEDWDLWYRLAKRWDFAYTLEPLACNRIHGGNTQKDSAIALACRLTVALRHLGDVRDSRTRAALVEQIRQDQTFLQEALLREGQDAGRYGGLLRNDIAPRSFRYRLGRALLAAPPGLRNAYAVSVRRAGAVRRRFGLYRS
jgi:hypothetical protein